MIIKHYMVYYVRYTLYTVHRTLYSEQGTIEVYNEKCIIYKKNTLK